MSRWATLFSRRGVASARDTPDDRAGRPSGTAPVEEVDGVVLLRSAGDDFPSLTEAAEVSLAVGGEDTVTVLVGAPAEGGGSATHWARLGDVLDTLRDRGTGRVRLVLSGAGHERADRPCLARRIADAWELEVIAPDGAVLITPGGTLFVPHPSTPAGGWWCFEPGTAPRPLGRRAPVPHWQSALRRVPARTSGGCLVHQIPAGLVIRPAEAPTPGTDDLSFAVPVHPERPLILVGAPDAEDVAAEEVATVLAALPAAHRSRARLAPGGRRDLLRLGQSVADMLDGEVEVLTGIPLLAEDPEAPGAVRPSLIGRTGEPTWQPYVASVVCRPAGAGDRPPMPRPTFVHPALVGIPGGRPDFTRLTDTWGVAATRAGLAVVPLDGPRPPVVTVSVDPETLTIELGVPGQPLDDSLLPALTRLLIELGFQARTRTTLLVRGQLTTGERALRDLATEHGVAGIRYVTRRTAPGWRTGGPATAPVAPAAALGAPAQASPPVRAPETPTVSGPPAPGGRAAATTAGERTVAEQTAAGPSDPTPVPASADRRRFAGRPGSEPVVGSESIAAERASSGPAAVAPPAAGKPLADGARRADDPPRRPRPDGTVPGRSLPLRPTTPAGAAAPAGPGQVDRTVAGPHTARPEGGTPAGDGPRGVRDVRATPPEPGRLPPHPPFSGTRPGPREDGQAPPCPDGGAGRPASGVPRPEGPVGRSREGAVVDPGATSGDGRATGVPSGARRIPSAPDGPDTGARAGSGEHPGPGDRAGGGPAAGHPPAAPDPDTAAPRAGTTAGTGPAAPGRTAPEATSHRPEAARHGSGDPGASTPAASGTAPPPPAALATGRTDPPAVPAPSISVPYRPGHVSTVTERAGFRDLVGSGWERHGAAVLRWLTRMPALRGQELEEARADLIALHAYLTDEDGPLHHTTLARDLRTGDGRLPGYAACLASALRRLPSHRGVAVRGAVPDAGEGVPEPGTLLLDPAPVGALALPRARPEGVPVRYVIWSVTGRKVRQLLDRTGAAAADEIVFAPGSAFRVLDTRTPHGVPVVLLRELSATAADYQGGAEEELSGLDRSALDRLEKALDGALSGDGGPGWPARCTGALGHGG
ncbi:hypothetical protein ABZY42_34610 [Streptomyces sp. NPDC006622]|uniref:hypothetical protein n=1 Tax=Streptomyces sp. NPDC006622 TaxID=3155459 RepID=UPI0033B4E087